MRFTLLVRKIIAAVTHDARCDALLALEHQVRKKYARRRPWLHREGTLPTGCETDRSPHRCDRDALQPERGGDRRKHERTIATAAAVRSEDQRAGSDHRSLRERAPAGDRARRIVARGEQCRRTEAEADRGRTSQQPTMRRPAVLDRMDGGAGTPACADECEADYSAPTLCAQCSALVVAAASSVGELRRSRVCSSRTARRATSIAISVGSGGSAWAHAGLAKAATPCDPPDTE